MPSRAALFPRIALTAGVGSVSSELSGLLGDATGTWSFAPSITAPIFAAGALRAQLKGARVDRDLAVARYEKGIQQAFAKVGNALTLRQTLVEQRQAQEALVEALAQTHRLSQARYEAGIDSYLSVLVAQRSLVAGQQALVAMRLAEQVNRITLYKVLGGGVLQPKGGHQGGRRSHACDAGLRASVRPPGQGRPHNPRASGPSRTARACATGVRRHMTCTRPHPDDVRDRAAP